MIEQKSFKALANFYHKQVEAAERVQDYDYILYGGAAGGGKSRWLRWTLIGRLIEFYLTRGLTNVRAGIFCETYTALDDRQLSKVVYEFPPWLGSMNQSRREFQLNPEYGGGILAFRNLDDPSKYLSSEFADIGIDELTMNRRETFDFLLTRLRWPGIKDSKLFAATNPGQIGHGWVKKLWIDQDFSEEKFNPNAFTFIRSLYTDNPYIDHLSYGNRLASLPDALRRAYMDGDWDIFAGQFFTEFRRDLHVIEPFQDEQTLRWFNNLPTYCGLDYGYHPHYTAVLWAKFHEGTWYIYRELYIREKTFEELRTIIEEIEIPVMIYADPSIWAKKDSPTSGADRMKPLPLRPAMNDRVIGWNGVKQLFKTNHIKIFSTCFNLIRTIPIQVYNERINSQAEDLDTQAEDHLCFCRHTKVLTANGDIPIMDVKVDDYIFTPLGWSRVQTIIKSQGKNLIDFQSTKATSNHPVLMQDGFRPLRDLKLTDKVWNASTSMESHIEDTRIQQGILIKSISDVLQRGVEARQQSIKMSGDSSRAKSLKESIYTTKMLIMSGMILRILRYTILPNTLNRIGRLMEVFDLSGVGKTLRKLSSQLQFGINPQRQKNFTNGLEKNHGKIKNNSSGNVMSAKNSIQPISRNQNFVALTVKCGCSDSEEVYNLSTDLGMYIANGVLVSNCDGLRYLIMTHRNIKPQQNPLNYSRNISKIPSKGSGDLGELFLPKKRNLIIPRYH